MIFMSACLDLSAMLGAELTSNSTPVAHLRDTCINFSIIYPFISLS